MVEFVVLNCEPMDGVSVWAEEPRCRDAVIDACEHDSEGVVRETEVAEAHGRAKNEPISR